MRGTYRARVPGVPMAFGGKDHLIPAEPLAAPGLPGILLIGRYTVVACRALAPATCTLAGDFHGRPR